MYYRKLVEDTYFECIALDPNLPLDLRTALKSHARIPLFLSNLAQELDKAQAARVGRGKSPIALNVIKSLVYEYTQMFIKGIQMQAEANYQSEVQKKLLEAQAQAQKDLEQTALGKPSGEFEEIFKDGVKTSDERSVL